MYENVQSLERSLFAYPMIDVVSHMFILDHGKIFMQSPTHHNIFRAAGTYEDIRTGPHHVFRILGEISIL